MQEQEGISDLTVQVLEGIASVEVYVQITLLAFFPWIWVWYSDYLVEFIWNCFNKFGFIWNCLLDLFGILFNWAKAEQVAFVCFWNVGLKIWFGSLLIHLIYYLFLDPSGLLVYVLVHISLLSGPASLMMMRRVRFWESRNPTSIGFLIFKKMQANMLY